MMNRTKALAISREVKAIVSERDGGRCIFCGDAGLPEAHYIPRSRGGLGIEENIVTACRICHYYLDQTTQRDKMLKTAREHLELWYPGFLDSERVYNRFGNGGYRQPPITNGRIESERIKKLKGESKQ